MCDTKKDNQNQETVKQEAPKEVEAPKLIIATESYEPKIDNKEKKQHKN